MSDKFYLAAGGLSIVLGLVAFKRGHKQGASFGLALALLALGIWVSRKYGMT